MAIQNRGVIDQWNRYNAAGKITPITNAAAFPGLPAVQKRRVIDNISFDNRTGGTITATVYVLPSGGTAPTDLVSFYFASYTTLTGGAVPNPTVCPIYLNAGDTLYALASATALNYLVNYRDEA